ncbi:MAG: GAF domain-containing sensor histidine kinase [Armatimonadetes bacterium]|nr:GAF domain-containing sensor histidine kinase [Armatimonadota bacterium]
MRTGRTYSLKAERLSAERQQAAIRVLMSLITSILLLKLYFFDQQAYIDYGLKNFIRPHHVFPHIILFMTYSLAVWALLKWKPQMMSGVMVVSSVIEIILITYLMNSPAAIYIPFYFWYIFYIACVATRYGRKFSLFALAASFISFTYTVCQLRGLKRMDAPADLGFMCFLLIMAYLFGQISEKQFSYQASLAIVNEFRADLTGLSSSSDIIKHLLAVVKDTLRVENAWFLPAHRGSDGSDTPGLRSEGADPVLLSTFREGGGEWNVESILQKRQTVVSNNPKRDPSLPKGIAAKLELSNIAAAPLLVRATQVGVIYASNRKDQKLSSADLQLLALMAAQTAPVVENAILWERLRESAASEERARIARDLHDNFLQTLAAINMHLERCRILINKDTNKALDGIDKIQDIATRALAEVRVYLSEFRMMGPEPTRFKQTIERCSAEAAIKAGFTVDADVHLPDEAIPPDVALAAFQIARELLNNAATHSHAEHVQVRVFVEDGNLILEIEDDGDGFEVESVRAQKAAQGHMGLMGIEERLKQTYGTLTIASQPGKGTRATAIFSLGRLTS